MAEIRNFPWIRHIRTEPTSFVLQFRRGRLKASGRGLAFWFMPMSSAVAEIPVDTRELTFLVHSKSRDFKNVAVQGEIDYRVAAPETLGDCLDFSIDLKTGRYLKQPLDLIASMLIGQCRQSVTELVAGQTVREVLSAEPSIFREKLEAGLQRNTALVEMGLQVLAVKVSAVSPGPDLEKALQTPTRELLQQEADQAVFERRALAVAKERAIAENELQNQIELAKQEQMLIDQQGCNARRQAEEEAEARHVRAESDAECVRVEAAAQSERIQLVDGARVNAEKARIEIYQDLAPGVIVGLAAQELATKLDTIEHLNVTPDLLAAGINNLLGLGTKQAIVGKS